MKAWRWFKCWNGWHNFTGGSWDETGCNIQCTNCRRWFRLTSIWDAIFGPPPLDGQIEGGKIWWVVLPFYFLVALWLAVPTSLLIFGSELSFAVGALLFGAIVPFGWMWLSERVRDTVLDIHRTGR